MSDVMLLGVLRMPMPDAPDQMTLRQFVSRARQAACRIEADTDELEELRAKCEAMRKDAERYRKMRSADIAMRNRLEHYADAALDVVLDALPAVGAA